MADGEASYVYAVARGVDPSGLVGVRGIGDGEVRIVVARELAALVTTVGLDEFGEQALRANLEQLTWLESVARAHHRVVDEVGASSAVVPLRLATIYLDDARVRGDLDRRRAELAAVLDRLDGRCEWSVKALWAPPTDTSDVPDEDASQHPGTAFLRRRQAVRSGYQAARRTAIAHAERLHVALAAVSVASRRHRPQPALLTGEKREMVLNGAYLIDGTGPAGLPEVLAGHAAGPLRCTMGGPWVPYSFAELAGDE